MISLDDHKTKSYEETLLPKLLLPSPPALQFKQIYQIKRKDSAEKTIEKGFSNKTKKSTGIYIQYPFNTDKVLGYYNQINQPLIHIFFDTIDLQKDYVNAFQPRYFLHMKISVENYLAFQHKMMLLYLNIYNIYLNIFNSIIKIKEQERDEGEK